MTRRRHSGASWKSNAVIYSDPCLSPLSLPATATSVSPRSGLPSPSDARGTAAVTEAVEGATTPTVSPPSQTPPVQVVVQAIDAEPALVSDVFSLSLSPPAAVAIARPTAIRWRDDDFNLLFLVFDSIYHRSEEISKDRKPELFRDVLRDIQNVCLRPTRDARRPLHMHPPSPTILVGNGPTRSAATLEVPGPPVRRTSAGVRHTTGKADGRKGSSWNEIVRQFAKEQHIPEKFLNASDINIVQLTEACCTKQTLEESHKMRDILVARIAKDVADRPTIFHGLIRELVYHRRIQDVVTTNFDTILEYALDDQSCDRRSKNAHRVHILVKNPTQAPLNRAILWPGASPRAVLVHKMHGSIPLNARPRDIGEADTQQPITYSDHKHWGDTIILSQRDYDAYVGELHTTFPGSLLSEALSCFLICCGKNFYTEDQTFLYALRKTQFERQSKGVTIDGEMFGGVVFYTTTPSMSDLLNLSTTGMMALRIAGAESLCKYLEKLNPLLPPSSPYKFDGRRLSLVAEHSSLRIMLQVTLAMMVLFDARRIEGFAELFAMEVTAIIDHLLEKKDASPAERGRRPSSEEHNSEENESSGSDSGSVDKIRRASAAERDKRGLFVLGVGRPRQFSETCLHEASRRRM